MDQTSRGTYALCHPNTRLLIHNIHYLIKHFESLPEKYLQVAKAPGQQLTEAQTRTPLLGPSGPACTLSFDYVLTGNPDHIGNSTCYSTSYSTLSASVRPFNVTLLSLPQVSCQSE